MSGIVPTCMSRGAARAWMLVRWVVPVIALTLVALALPARAAPAIDYDPGRSDELRECDQHQYRGRIDPARRCYSQLLEIAEPMVQAESAWALGDLRRANELFRAITQRDERAVRPRVRWARLFLQTHQYAEAAALLREAQALDPDDPLAKLGLARLFTERFEGEARPLIESALEQDGELIEAHLLLARMALEENRQSRAEESLARAARIASRRQWPALEIHTLRAALERARDRRPDRWVERVLAENPHYGAVYEQLAHFEIMQRRYREADTLLRQAVEVQPDLWSAHAELGLNLLRLGQVEEARTHLVRAYSGDPYRPTIVNTLRLLDRMEQFEVASRVVTIGSERVEIRTRLHGSEAAVLGPYILDLAREGVVAFSQRYGFVPREPITIELYPDHDDFAVRVAALPGIGLLGVTFGYVLAMDSPAARSRGEFHWGSTLWHELAHVFTLEATDHHVPRWLSEGISVFEEWRTGPTPGVVVPPEAIAALHDGRLLPVSDLDAGFIRPSYPNQVQVSYVQAGLVCLFIEQRWGVERLVALLRQFARAGKQPTSAAAIEATFEISPQAFDQQFESFVRQRFAGLLAGLDTWQRQYDTALKAVREQRWADAVEPARRATQLYPEHTGPDSPALLLARALDGLNRRQEAIEAMEAYRAAGGWDPDALRQLADWLEQAGRGAQRTALLQAINYADPFDARQHLQLGELLLTEQRARESLREFEALLILNPHDPAPAHFGAARALRALGESEPSRRRLLEALASAPHYKPAQALLLQLIQERTGNE